MWWNFAQLHTRAGDDPFRFIFGTGEPAEVIFSLKHLPKRIPRLDPKGFKQIQRQLAHVLKHAGAMPADEIDIGRGREAKLKSVRHQSNPFQ